MTIKEMFNLGKTIKSSLFKQKKEDIIKIIESPKETEKTVNVYDDSPIDYDEHLYYNDDICCTAEDVNRFKVEKENNFHKKKLMEICENYTEEEALIACRVFARKFPGIMHTSLCDEHQNMAAMISVINKSQIAYMDKMCTP